MNPVWHRLALLLGLIASAPAQASILHPAIPKAISTAVPPGRHSVNLAHLDPEFRAQVEAMITNLEEQATRPSRVHLPPVVGRTCSIA